MRRAVRGWSPWARIALAALLCAVICALAGCKTCPPRPSPAPVVITWPTLPDPVGKVEFKDGKAIVDGEYWLAVVQYIVDMEHARDLVEAGK